jgi:hypothetical protein
MSHRSCLARAGVPPPLRIRSAPAGSTFTNIEFVEGAVESETYANGIQKLVYDVVNQLVARLGMLYELTNRASAAVIAEALGYSPR